MTPFVRVLTWCPDEGVAEYGAEQILHGSIPGRDFLELYAPGSYYWLALFFKLFGASITTARTLLLAEGTITALLVFYFARRLGGLGISAAAFVLTTSIPYEVRTSPHYDANLFALLSLALFLCGERRLRQGSSTGPAYVLLLVAGGFAGWTSCLTQHKGILVLASFAVSVVLLRPRKRLTALAILLAGFSLPIAAGLLFYTAHGALPDLIYANFILPASLYGRINAVPYGFPLRDILRTWLAVGRTAFPFPIAFCFVGALAVPFVVIMILPAIVPVMGYLHRRLVFRPEWMPYWLAAFALWISELQRLDLGHLRNGTLLLVVLFFALAETYRGRLAKPMTIAVTACIIAMAIVNLIGARAAYNVIQSRRGTLVARQPDRALEFLLKHTRPGDDIFVYPFHPVYYFLAGVHKPTRLSCFLYDPAADALFREAVHDLEIKRVRYVLWDAVFAGRNLASLFPAYHHPPPAGLIIEPYLETHYHQVAFENGFRIMERNH